jgi:hypothetical protein
VFDRLQRRKLQNQTGGHGMNMVISITEILSILQQQIPGRFISTVRALPQDVRPQTSDQVGKHSINSIIILD